MTTKITSMAKLLVGAFFALGTVGISHAGAESSVKVSSSGETGGKAGGAGETGGKAGGAGETGGKAGGAGETGGKAGGTGETSGKAGGETGGGATLSPPATPPLPC